MMGKGNELEFPEGRGGCKGSEVAKRPQPYCAKRNGGSNAVRGFPLGFIILHSVKYTNFNFFE